MGRPSPALIVALLALFVALGGTTYAAVQIHGSQIVDNTIGTSKLHNGAVTGAKLAPSVRARLLARPTLGRRGAAGAQSPRGTTGRRGATGAQGPRGAAGAQGPRGATGAQGPAGATGEQGPRGATGPQGSAGTAGPQGESGPQGPQGVPGPGSQRRLVATATDTPHSIPAGQCWSPGSVSTTESLAVGDLIIPVADTGFSFGLFLPVSAATRTDSILVTYCNPLLVDAGTTSGGDLTISYYAVSLPTAAP